MGFTSNGLIRYVVQALVDYPEDVIVTEVVGDRTVVLELRVAKADLGKVIDKSGRTAQALRAILGAASGKSGKRHVLEVID